MEESSLGVRFLTLIKENLLVSALICIGLICLCIGVIQYLSPSPQAIEFKSGQDVMSASTSAAVTSEIVIDVSGEVESPGVYTMSSDSRLKDALTAAGGLSANANREYVSKALNLASKLHDGAKIYIPGLGEEGAPAIANTGLQEDVRPGNASIISINSSTQSQLEALPGIGPVTALKIINNRPYNSLEELLAKKSVGKSVFEKLKDQISL